MKVLLIGKAANNPSTRYRLEPLADRFRALGHEVRVCYEPDFLTQVKLLKEAGTAELVYIQRKLLTGFMVRLLRFRAKKLIFDFDDAVFLRSNGLESASRGNKFGAVTRLSDLVIAGNGYLQDAARAGGSRVEVIPTCVDMARYQAPVEKQSIFTLVWIGSSSTSRYLELVRDDLEEIGKANPGIRLRIIADFELTLQFMETECVPWSEAREVELLKQSHVGIAPMKDDPWTRGKCALKVIQYMAAGLPVISSDVGANREVVDDGESGILVSDRQGWLDAVAKLRNSDVLRESMGQKARTASEERYSILNTSEKLASRLLDLVDEAQ